MSLEDIFTRGGTYVMAACITMLTFFTRRIVERLCPSWNAKGGRYAREYTSRAAEWWNTVILYSIPVCWGALFALSDSEFFFADLTGEAKLVFALGIGWLASFLFKLLKKILAGLFLGSGARLGDGGL